ncbi:hypothetical protein SAMN02745164_00848 [Marinitoga hydrogenitolerans DSM 16785]|uniref:Uncharacterized protein n=1 Tax=Marinitoga hydrogenitolerans (strain DSM 16785 / JCM 12826 / AT1271) TaxID=1122195 RepID=A0A1M4V733_MARH1|nr:hypothetical protein [Marinitoga hydrogenitolerans]SHE64796.1 hypothetical protein SAMN02745164_00848 [Marinitoga hydrogenitolerans DSM 16785]
MKKIINIILFTLFATLIFSFNGDLQYIYGYNFSDESSKTYSGLKSNITLENSMDSLYFKLSLDLFRLDEGKNSLKIDTTNIMGLIPSELIKPNIPWTLYVLNEAYSDIYIEDSTLKFGRFILNNGSSTLYSPSVLLNAHDGLNPFENYKSLPVDGIEFNGYLNDYGYNFIFTPKTYDDIPGFYLYPISINRNIAEENATILTYQFTQKHEEAIAAIAALKAQLESSGLSDTEIEAMLQNPELLSNAGLSETQILQVYLGQTLLTLPKEYNIKTTTISATNVDELNTLNGNYSLDFTTSLMNFDVKLGYVHDHYHFMVPEKIDIQYSEDGSGTSKTILYRPARNSIILDTQGISNLFDSISYHGEAAFIIPEKKYVVVNTSYYIPDTNQPTKTIATKTSTNIEIFEKYYVKMIGGIEYTKGEDFTLGIEGFNGLPTEELKDNISFGSDAYLKMKISDISFEGLGLIAFSKIDNKYKPGYMTNIKISYSGIDNFEPSLQLKYAYSEDKKHSLKQIEKLNAISLNIKIYF